MDGSARLRTPPRSLAGPAHPSCPYPGDERRQLPPQTKPPQTGATLRRPLIHLTLLPGHHTQCWGAGPLPLRSRAPAPQQILKQLPTLLAPFYSATVDYFYSALDTLDGPC